MFSIKFNLCLFFFWLDTYLLNVNAQKYNKFYPNEYYYLFLNRVILVMSKEKGRSISEFLYIN